MQTKTVEQLKNAIAVLTHEVTQLQSIDWPVSAHYEEIKRAKEELRKLEEKNGNQ